MTEVGETALTTSSSSRSSQRRRKAPRVLRRLVRLADIDFDGDRPWDIQVHDPGLYTRVLRHGSLGFGESFMEGCWDSTELDETFNRLLSARIDRKLSTVVRMQFAGEVLKNLLINRQSRQRAFEVGEKHYDIGNDVYQAMLDSSMSYSCGYWKAASNLEQAQQAKLRLTCDKLQLQPGQRLLDIGCGWGGLARFAAENYGVQVVGLTVSREQQALAQERCNGLPVRIELMDYRDVQGRFDRIVSVGMFEHVGPKNYTKFFETVERALEDQGLFLLHTIGLSETTHSTDAWIDKYIFPNGKLPSARQLTMAFEPYFIFEDWHNFGQDYDLTLMAWWRNFDAAWPRLKERYGERFYRMWKYYLLSCAGFFRSRQGQLWQLVLAKHARHAVYRAPR